MARAGLEIRDLARKFERTFCWIVVRPFNTNGGIYSNRVGVFCPYSTGFMMQQGEVQVNCPRTPIFVQSPGRRIVFGHVNSKRTRMSLAVRVPFRPHFGDLFVDQDMDYVLGLRKVTN